MRVFISWSGSASKMCAEQLRDWLPYMNQAIEPFVSSQDIAKGERGLGKIASELQGCSYGIVCVTKENQAAPWINFESGALSRELDQSVLAPFLLDLSVKDITGPIAQFQATESGSRSDVWNLVKSLNAKCATSVEMGRLEELYRRFWDDLNEGLRKIRSTQPSDEEPPGRSTSEILNELVALVREQSTRIQKLEARTSNVGDRAVTNNYTINDPHNVQFDMDEQRGKERKDELTQVVMRAVGVDNVTLVIPHQNEIDFTVNAEGLKRAASKRNLLERATQHFKFSVSIWGEDRKVEERVHVAP